MRARIEKRFRGRNAYMWVTLGDEAGDFEYWSQRTGLTRKTIASRIGRMPQDRECDPDELRLALFESTHDRKSRITAAVRAAKGYNGKRSDPWMRDNGKCFSYSLEHLLALGSPVAIRAEFERRLAEGWQ